MIGDYQFAFIKSRNILECVAQAFTTIHQARRTGGNGYLLKLDVEKTCDLVDWECLIEVLKHRGFGRLWTS